MSARRGSLTCLAVTMTCLISLAAVGLYSRQHLVEQYYRWWPAYQLQVTRTEIQGRFVITLTNRTEQELRIWKFWNSWGWWTMAFRIKTANGVDALIQRTHTVEWTRNFPSYYRIDPNGQLKTEIDLHDGSWEIPATVDL